MQEEYSSDIYRKAPPKIIAKNSIYATISLAKPRQYVLFTGLDNRIRLCIFNKGIWERNEPPLIGGYKLLYSSCLDADELSDMAFIDLKSDNIVVDSDLVEKILKQCGVKVNGRR